MYLQYQNPQNATRIIKAPRVLHSVEGVAFGFSWRFAECRGFSQPVRDSNF